MSDGQDARAEVQDRGKSQMVCGVLEKDKGNTVDGVWKVWELVGWREECVIMYGGGIKWWMRHFSHITRRGRGMIVHTHSLTNTLTFKERPIEEHTRERKGRRKRGQTEERRGF